ncbi:MULTISPECIES: restriction endonuclease subunit S [unclassified Pseudoalteromonas]|uniref:restriction endonuclease subunit S n=1 Tax=unclassified Pseudoalteromonas TaxID=194690 RepID=UPI0020981DB3|nr:restriction endonuclease subunit S [Pseudoalteromonas sp. XMcav2-N]MCO7187939.1 restriction endonuclease subunit S [Pseudoalteromonas sp. XMcav2-N]
MTDTMIKRMSKYESYKESNVDWIGKIPKEWDVVRLGGLFRERRTKVSDLDFPALSVTKKGILPQLDSAAKTKDGDNRKLVKCGDFVINSRSDRKGSSGVSDRDGSVSLINIVLEPQKIEATFCHHLLKSNAFIEEYYRVGRGIVADLWTTRYDEMRTISLALPSKTEQVAIARFLDEKTAQIDEAIAIKQKQIDLLKERKQIIIQQAVTQGLNPDVPMKDSGVDWIGEIPEHWGIVRFKNLFTQSRLPVRKGDGVVTSYRDGQVTLRSNRRVGGYTEAILEGGYQGIRKGQLVLNSMDAFEGAIGVSDSDGKCTPEYVICDPINSVNVSQYYFAYLLREMALAKYIQVICNAVRQRAVRIRYNNLAPLFMVVPPVKEQEDIVSFIEKESAKLDAGIKHLNEQISKLKEYKTTLINSAVTGKIKVTELA